MKSGLVNYEIANELRKLILENPELPILVFVGDEVNTGDYRYMSAADVTAVVGEVLDCEVPGWDGVITDRDDLEEAIWDYYRDDFEGNDSEWDAYFDKKLDEFEPFWVKAIIVYVD